MRLFNIPHPDGVDELPAGFASWALAWDATEKQAKAEREQAEAEKQKHG
jgi:hypothetical protein